MDKGGTKKGKAVKQLPAVKDMKDKLLTNQREAVSVAGSSHSLTDWRLSLLL